MKKIFKFLTLILAFLFTFTSCDRNDDILKVDIANAPILLNASASEIALDGNFPGNIGLTVFWDSSNYTVPTEINYKVEVSNTNTFEKIYLLGTTNASIRTASYTIEQVNKAATALGLVANTYSDMYIRVTSSLGDNNYVSSASNVVKVSVKPYLLVYPDFYLVGAASYVGWNAGNAQFLYKNSSTSTIYTYLEKDQNFRFLGQKDWGPINYSIDADGIRTAYKYFKQVSSNISKADGDDENMRFSGETGVYKVSIDAFAGVQSLSAVASPIFNYNFDNIYIVGTLNDWNAGSAPSMTKVGDGVYEYVTTLADSSAFKILGQQSFGSLEWGNIGGAGNTGFLGPKGDNGDIKFEGGGNTYKITVNIKGGIYTIVQQ